MFEVHASNLRGEPGVEANAGWRSGPLTSWVSGCTRLKCRRVFLHEAADDGVQWPTEPPKPAVVVALIQHKQ